MGQVLKRQNDCRKGGFMRQEQGGFPVEIDEYPAADIQYSGKNYHVHELPIDEQPFVKHPYKFSRETENSDFWQENYREAGISSKYINTGLLFQGTMKEQ